MAKTNEKKQEAVKLFKRVEEEEVRCLVVGGTAAVLYGVERATFDLDIGVPPDEDNLKHLLFLLSNLGYKECYDTDAGKFIATLDNIKAEDIINMESIEVKNGHTIDILIIPKDTFEVMWKHKVMVSYGETKIPIPNILDLIRLKEKASRPIDLEDAKKLRYIFRTKKR